MPRQKKTGAAPSAPSATPEQAPELVVITGLSGSGKGTVLKAFEDNGYYAVDNLPVDLIPTFAKLTKDSPSIRRAALVVDIREGESLKRFPAIFSAIKRDIRTRLLFLDAGDDTLIRRFSETRRPHPLGQDRSVLGNVLTERELLAPIRALADHVLMTSEMNVHQLRRRILETFGSPTDVRLVVSSLSFGFRHGVPTDADLVFDVRFLPNPNYIPEFKDLTGRNLRVARFIRSYPQTEEFIERVASMLLFLMPHYIHEGKSYLTIAFGCTGGRHRSVMMAEEIGKRLQKSGYHAKISPRDISK
jgi:RNase adapter protein RapZ